jgi:hypothetical protein
VATPIGGEGLEDLVGQGVTVTRSAPAMAEAVLDYLGDPEKAIRDGLRGSQAVADRYAWDVVLEPLMQQVREATSIVGQRGISRSLSQPNASA